MQAPLDDVPMPPVPPKLTTKKTAPPANLPVGGPDSRQYKPVAPKIQKSKEEPSVPLPKTTIAPARPINILQQKVAKDSPTDGAPPVTFLDKKGNIEKPQPPKKKSSIRTYYSDIAETIRDTNLSMTGIAIAENKRAHQEVRGPAPEPEESAEPKASRAAIIILAFVLVALGAGIFGFFFASREGPDMAEVDLPPESLIPTESSRTIDVTGFTREDLLSTLERTRDGATGAVETIEHIHLIETLPGRNTSKTQALGARALFGMVAARVDNAFLRSIEPEFMLGIHALDRDHYFLILKTSFFENMFAGMLRWEKSLADDMPFLVNVLTQPAATGTPRTSSGRLTAQDVVIVNRDVRVLSDSLGNPRIMYSLPDRNTLIIASNEDTMKEVFERINVRSFGQ